MKTREKIEGVAFGVLAGLAVVFVVVMCAEVLTTQAAYILEVRKESP